MGAEGAPPRGQGSAFQGTHSSILEWLLQPDLFFPMKLRKSSTQGFLCTSQSTFTISCAFSLRDADGVWVVARARGGAEG